MPVMSWDGGPARMRTTLGDIAAAALRIEKLAAEQNRDPFALAGA